MSLESEDKVEVWSTRAQRLTQDTNLRLSPYLSHRQAQRQRRARGQQAGGPQKVYPGLSSDEMLLASRRWTFRVGADNGSGTSDHRQRRRMAWAFGCVRMRA